LFRQCRRKKPRNRIIDYYRFAFCDDFYSPSGIKNTLEKARFLYDPFLCAPKEMGQQPGWAYIYICGTFFLCLKLLHGTEKAEAQLQLSLVRQVCIERVHRAAHVHVLHSLNEKKASYPCSFFQPRKNEPKKWPARNPLRPASARAAKITHTPRWARQAGNDFLTHPSLQPSGRAWFQGREGREVLNLLDIQNVRIDPQYSKTISLFSFFVRVGHEKPRVGERNAAISFCSGCP